MFGPAVFEVLNRYRKSKPLSTQDDTYIINSLSYTSHARICTRIILDPVNHTIETIETGKTLRSGRRLLRVFGRG
jgi:hypothetical protein